VAFSPDGKLLASGGGGHTVRLWDMAEGQEPVSLAGHDQSVSSVAFSPDGRRLASGSRDWTVKLWDLAGRQEVSTLKIHAGMVDAVAFSPDGKLLASGADNTVRLWEAPRTLPDVWVRRRAFRLVQTLFDELVRKADVLDRIRGDDALGERLRQEALSLAERYAQDPEALDDASTKVVRQPGADEAAYRRALLQAEEACRLSPDNDDYLDTLAAARYRVGQYAQAVDTLARSVKIKAGRDEAPDPWCLAFLAMAHHQLGHVEEARAFLARLREALKQPEVAEDDRARALLLEAEALIEGKSSKP
jgi:tetratricopeptide (TPR) repeat protein